MGDSESSLECGTSEHYPCIRPNAVPGTTVSSYPLGCVGPAANSTPSGWLTLRPNSDKSLESDCNTNVMQTPYCTTAYFSLRNHGWMGSWNFDSGQFTAIKVQELQNVSFWLVHCVFCLCADLFSDLGREDKTRSMEY